MPPPFAHPSIVVQLLETTRTYVLALNELHPEYAKGAIAAAVVALLIDVDNVRHRRDVFAPYQGSVDQLVNNLRSIVEVGWDWDWVDPQT